MAKKTVKKKTRRKVARAPGGAEQPAAAPDASVVPKRFDDIAGHARAIGVLSGAIASGRVHHAWIFHGPRGVGKRTAALAFAAALLDPTTEVGADGVARPAPDSAVAGLLASAAHPDLHVITKELARFSDDDKTRSAKLASIPKEVVESRLIRRIALSPSVTEHGVASRVFIVDEAELLDRSTSNAPVQNALLKTLEEPPAGAVLILVTSSEDRLLPTIRSRCQRVAFGPVDDGAMRAWVEDGADLPARWSEVSPAGRTFLIDFASGSPGVLTEAVEAGLDGWHETLGPMLDRAIAGDLPTTLGKSMQDLVSSFADDAVKSDKNASKLAASQRGVELLLRVVARALRSAMVVAAGTGDHDAASAIAGRMAAVNAAATRQRSSVSLAFVCDALAADLAGAGS